jgi:hypothetical protein
MINIPVPRGQGLSLPLNYISLVARSPVTDWLPEITNPQQGEAGNDNPKKAQGHQQGYYPNTFLNKGCFAVVKNEQLRAYVQMY